MTTSDLHAAVSLVCPIHGVSIGRVSDKATWRIDYKPEATSQQRADAQAVVAGFNFSAPSAEETRAATIRALPDRIDLLNRLKTATPAQIDTWIDNNVTNVAAARTVLKAILKVIALDHRT